MKYNDWDDLLFNYYAPVRCKVGLAGQQIKQTSTLTLSGCIHLAFYSLWLYVATLAWKEVGIERNKKRPALIFFAIASHEETQHNTSQEALSSGSASDLHEATRTFNDEELS